MIDQTVFQSQVERNIGRLRAASVAAYLVAFMLLSLTVTYGLSKIRVAHANLERVMAQHNRQVQLITETQVAAFRRADTIQLMLLEQDPFKQDELFMAYLRYGFQVGDGRNRIRALLDSDAEKALLTRQDKIIAEAVGLHDRVTDLVRSGAHEAARAIFVEQLAQMHEQGHATFQGLRDLQTRAAEQTIDAANAEYKQTLSTTVVAMLISLAASISVALMMYHTSGRITQRLRDNVGNLHRQATQDSLTGLLNRSTITGLIDQELDSGRHFALLYMDLDGFKQVNDAHGHAFGDKLLALSAARIRGRMRGIDALARIGGDEFVAVLKDVSDHAECARAARHLIEAFQQPFIHDGVETRIGISIGAAIAPAAGSNAAQLLNAADGAMYRAKHRGRNGYELHPHANGTDPQQTLAS
ncbi:MAG: diguanylate cyclase [Chromatiaceae bacterium]|nr:diguanylate cyclase [Chromatiaceae bacterium]